MSRTDSPETQTRTLERLGFVLRASHVQQQPDSRPLHAHPGRGRKKVYRSAYERLKAHRRNKSRMITK